jgi:hypothetical protein
MFTDPTMLSVARDCIPVLIAMSNLVYWIAVWHITIQRVSFYLFPAYHLFTLDQVTHLRMRIYSITSFLVSFRLVTTAAAKPCFFLSCLLLAPLPFEEHGEKVQEIELGPQNVEESELSSLVTLP